MDAGVPSEFCDTLARDDYQEPGSLRADACFALAEQASEEAGAAQRYSSAADVWVTALSAFALARSSQARPGHSLFVRGGCPLDEARHAELVGGGARLLEVSAALG
jgi:hypothetical protein